MTYRSVREVVWWRDRQKYNFVVVSVEFSIFQTCFLQTNIVKRSIIQLSVHSRAYVYVFIIEFKNYL